MAKRYFGLDIGPLSSYLAVLDIEGSELKRVQLLESHRHDLAAQLAELTENLSGDFKIGDRLAAALPAKTAYIRELEFPFSDNKKIMAALPFAMSSQIPIPIDECFTASLPLKARGKGPVKVTAAAVPKNRIQEILDQTENCGMPLHVLDLSPFVLLSGLGDQLSQGILLAANSHETTLSVIHDGQIEDYRLLPQPLSEQNTFWLNRELTQFSARNTNQQTTIYCVGDAITSDLTSHLFELGYQVKELTMVIAGEQIPMKYMQAVSLAFRAGKTKDLSSFNLRHGSFALKGEWQKLKKSLWCTAILGLATVAILVSSAATRYQTQLNQVDKLQQQIVQIYRDTFPNATTIVDVPLQMQSAINELREKNSMVGSMGPDVLTVLKAFSEQIETIAMQVDEFNYAPPEVRVSGSTSSFEAVNQLSEQLSASPLFSKVQVADAQMALRGNKINFRLILSLAQGGSAQ